MITKLKIYRCKNVCCLVIPYVNIWKNLVPFKNSNFYFYMVKHTILNNLKHLSFNNYKAYNHCWTLKILQLLWDK